MNSHFYSNGKLLLTSEYGVLDGALALAVPTKFGQTMDIEIINEPVIKWNSLNEKGETWFEATFDCSTFKTQSSSNMEFSKRLEEILLKTNELNPKFNSVSRGHRITTKLSFPRNWGLGSSSTLINNIAQWARIDPYKLLEATFGGSGYDIACAQNNSPIHYQLAEGKPSIKPVRFNPPFKDNLYFIFLNKKQDSREAIANYRKRDFNIQNLVKELTELTLKITTEQRIDIFEEHLKLHEELLSKVLGIEPVKLHLFPDYFGSIKSLGGWGGDFVLATGNEKTPDYFKAKGFDIVIPYGDMIL